MISSTKVAPLRTEAVEKTALWAKYCARNRNMVIYLNRTSVISVPTVDFHEKSCQGSSKYEVSLPWSHRDP